MLCRRNGVLCPHFGNLPLLWYFYIVLHVHAIHALFQRQDGLIPHLVLLYVSKFLSITLLYNHLTSLFYFTSGWLGK